MPVLLPLSRKLWCPLYGRERHGPTLYCVITLQCPLAIAWPPTWIFIKSVTNAQAQINIMVELVSTDAHSGPRRSMLRRLHSSQSQSSPCLDTAILPLIALLLFLFSLLLHLSAQERNFSVLPHTLSLVHSFLVIHSSLDCYQLTNGYAGPLGLIVGRKNWRQTMARLATWVLSGDKQVMEQPIHSLFFSLMKSTTSTSCKVPRTTFYRMSLILGHMAEPEQLKLIDCCKKRFPVPYKWGDQPPYRLIGFMFLVQDLAQPP